MAQDKTQDKIQELIGLLNKALEDEHQANIQYLSHAEVIDGLDCEPIIARLKEIASDEKKHAEMFRTLIGDFLDGVPSVGMTKAKVGKDVKEILTMNIKNEKGAVDLYKNILKKINEAKELLPYSYWRLEHDLRHIMMEEQEHISELRRLLGMKMSQVERL